MSTTTTTTGRAHDTYRPKTRGALWAVAFTLTALILLRASGVGPEQTALADMVADSGSYTVLTTKSGTAELLYLIDDRSEQLHIYRVKQAKAVELVAREDLRQMFTAAAAAWLGSQPGRPRP